MSDDVPMAAKLTAAIFDAILTTFGIPETGEGIVDQEATRQALILVLSMMLEANPDLRTPTDIREAADDIGRLVRLQVRKVRNNFLHTGEREWNGTPINIPLMSQLQ